MSHRLPLAVGLLALGTGAGGGDEVLRNRVTLGADFGISPVADEAVAGGGMIDERLRATVIDGDGLTGTVFVKARLRYQLSEEAARWENSRVREVRLNLDGGGWELDLGRIPVDRGLRLVDGAMGMASVGGGWWVGAYAGAGADPYTTLPGARFGGGPVLRYAGDRASWQTTGEVMFATGGLDRLAVASDAQVELTERVEVSARVDVQHRGAAMPLALADGMVVLSARPVDDLRLSALYDAYSSLAYLVTEKQDPSITRFDARAVTLDPELAAIADALDDTLYQLTGASARYTPTVGSLRLNLRAVGRYRYHVEPDNRFARASLEEGLMGIGGGRLDLTLTQSALQWGGSLGTTGGALVYFEPAPELGLALDASVEVGLKPLREDPSILGSQLYVDGYLDWISNDGRFIVSAGYAFTRVLDFDLWDDYHAGIARITWYEKVRRGSK